MFALCMLAGIAPSRADWPVFRGNALQTGVAAEELPKKLALKWTFKTGVDGKSGGCDGAPAIVNSVVYIGSFDGNLYALDLETGKSKWKFAAGPIKAPVSVHDGCVFAGNEEGVFHCVDANTGASKWKYDVGIEVTSGANFASDSVLFGCGNETLYCLNRKDGSVRWKFQVAGGPVQGTPVVVNGQTYAAGCDSQLHAIDLATGKEISSVDLSGQVGATAAVRDNKLYVGTMTNQVVAVDLKKMEVLWRFEAERRKQPFYASCAATEKLILAGSRDKRLYGIDRATGKQVWSFVTENRVESSPVVTGDRVVFGSQDGHLYVVDLVNGSEVQKIKLDSAIDASPAIGGGRLVVGSEKGTVYCFGKE